MFRNGQGSQAQASPPAAVPQHPVAASPPAAVPQRPRAPQEGEGDKRWLSPFEYQLQRFDSERDPIVRKGEKGQR